MSRNSFFGLDFGTSNTAISYANDGRDNINMISLEGNSPILPSCLFYSFTNFTTPVFYGEEASDLFIEGEFGRYFRGLKSMLGSKLIDDRFMIKHNVLSFKDVLEQFLKYIKYTAETQSQMDIDNIVIGRPVFFVDNNPENDSLAERQLLESLSNVGFKNISFQYEPIAAALDYERNLSKEQLVMVIDIGGGTSDFSLIKIGGSHKHIPDRSNDILSNTGVHIGGTNLDYDLSMHSVMPLIGSKSITKQHKREINQAPFSTLATWHTIHQLYEKKEMDFLRSLIPLIENSNNYRRFIRVLEKKLGYHIAYEVEQAKIALTHDLSSEIDLSLIEKGFYLDVNKTDFEDAAEKSLIGVKEKIQECISTAQVRPTDISTILFTGGTTNIPAIRLLATSIMPNAKQISNDIFSSVSRGLSIDCYRKFQ